ncbi:DUF4256 domain-containing protein [Chryseobacterium sp. SNU WT5]|uniref:DUF4256 domain-containing protein n=1 Tax=Chryseobacterium sp. SNU WT5 TaxID=2594269 RepID=UPI00117C15C8|nr:DUF4256 domain-containing protein [Chryseobacterium sp. SNU WT5]QDP85332.1 DUF4256 domain-containing protein [Chryseobacterium sp. SNU WT5]
MRNTELSKERTEELLVILEKRFVNNKERHPDLKWEDVQKKLEGNPTKLWSVNEMEETDGEPDVIGYDKTTKEFLYCDCAAESPKARRSVCYDHEALASRKEHKPKDSAVNMANRMGTTLLNEEQYRTLQKLGIFDSKTSSWLLTPPEIRELGGAIFGDRRFNHIFIYHNGAESYYSGRGFRSLLRV